MARANYKQSIENYINRLEFVINHEVTPKKYQRNYKLFLKIVIENISGFSTRDEAFEESLDERLNGDYFRAMIIGNLASILPSVTPKYWDRYVDGVIDRIEYLLKD